MPHITKRLDLIGLSFAFLLSYSGLAKSGLADQIQDKLTSNTDLDEQVVNAGIEFLTALTAPIQVKGSVQVVNGIKDITIKIPASHKAIRGEVVASSHFPYYFYLKSEDKTFSIVVSTPDPDVLRFTFAGKLQARYAGEGLSDAAYEAIFKGGFYWHTLMMPGVEAEIQDGLRRASKNTCIKFIYLDFFPSKGDVVVAAEAENMDRSEGVITALKAKIPYLRVAHSSVSFGMMISHKWSKGEIEPGKAEYINKLFKSTDDGGRTNWVLE